MSHIARLEYGKYYHVFNRGNNRENIFVARRNYEYFMQLYWKYVDVVAVTYAYCLMPNRFHFLVRIKDEKEITARPDRSHAARSIERPVRSTQPNPTQQFSNLFNSYARSFNNAYDRSGNLFKRPFMRKEIESDQYFVHLIHYIHFNPQKHGFVKDFRKYHFSSYQTILGENPTNLARPNVLEWFGGVESFERIHETMTAEKELHAFAELEYENPRNHLLIT